MYKQHQGPSKWHITKNDAVQSQADSPIAKIRLVTMVQPPSPKIMPPRPESLAKTSRSKE